MTIAVKPARKPSQAVPNGTVTAFGRPLHRITVEQYHRMQEEGAFRKEDRCELIHGFLLEKPTIKPPHASATSRTMNQIVALLGFEVVVRSQLPITLADSEPEPDAVIASGTYDDYDTRHPGPHDILFLIEVSDTSLEFDRGVKLSLYAEAGIPQYWILNIAERCIEVYTQPRSGKQPSYRKTARYSHQDAVPVTVGGKKLGTIPVAKLIT
jgi:Uma2 family endonuclease